MHFSVFTVAGPIENINQCILLIGSTVAILVISYFFYIAFRLKPWPVCLLKQKRNLHYLYHSRDLVALGTFLFTKKMPQVPKELDTNWAWCYKMLMLTSPSFANVILELNDELIGPIAVFYLSLRALDTIEDDMKPSITIKKEQLITFYTHLEEDGYNLHGYGNKKHEIDLLENYSKLVSAFKQLKPKYKEIITDICKRMGAGMAEFLDRKIITVKNYELYCHYVAGLVGHGLSSLFEVSGLERHRYGSKALEPLSNSMGLLLQKTNIICDYLTDISDVPPRLFWPMELLEKYTIRVQDLALWENKTIAVYCLNDLVTDALKHSIECLDYLDHLTEPSIFKFCAIPQLLAISTLELCYNNHDVFLYRIKIPKGEAIRLFLSAKNYKSVVTCFKYYALKFLTKISKVDYNTGLTKLRIEKLLERCEADLKN